MQATADMIARRLVRVLAAVAADPGLRLRAVPVLGAGERRRLLVEWNDTAREVGAVSVLELFGAQVAGVPGAVAVVCGGVRLSYGELEAGANRLAHYLRGLGAGPETVVGLCLGRGVEMLVGILGVWKAGAAYLPVDPGYPAGRTAFMLADSGVAVVLGTADVLGELAGRVFGQWRWMIRWWLRGWRRARCRCRGLRWRRVSWRM